MSSYRVCFINEIPRNHKLFRCCQRSIVIPSAPSSEWAIEAAKQQFAKLEGISDWRIRAALIETEAVDIKAEPETASPSESRDPARAPRSSPGAVDRQRRAGRVDRIGGL
jgi:hypothetical protein